MRSTRVLYLLISLLQFIFFLKLIEYVRGEEVQKGGNYEHLFKRDEGIDSFNGTESDEVKLAKGLFMAPNMNMKRKRVERIKKGQLVKKQNSTKSNSAIKRSDIKPVKNVQQRNLTTLKLRKDEGNIPNQGRLCPACENNVCPETDPIASGFPIVPFVIAVAVGVAWFLLFLVFWLFWIRPGKNKHESGGGGGGGYGGYGSSHPQPEYGPMPSGGYYDGNGDDDQPSIFEQFLKPHERSFSSYLQLINRVLDAVGKYSELYNE